MHVGCQLRCCKVRAMQPERLFPARSITPSSRPQRPHPPSSRPQRPPHRHPDRSVATHRHPDRSAQRAVNFVIPTAARRHRNKLRHPDRRRRTLPPQWRDPRISPLPLPLPVLSLCRCLFLPSFRSPLVCHSAALLFVIPQRSGGICLCLCRCSKAPKARAIPAWGIAPGNRPCNPRGLKPDLSPAHSS